MSADSFDNFPYEPDRREADEAARRQYWAMAIGLQAVDGLEVSPYLRDLSRGYVAGSYTLEQTGSLIRAYHADEAAGDSSVERAEASGVRRALAHAATAEADLVSQRIAELLERGTFFLAPDMLSNIHATLFQDLDKDVYQPGAYKKERLVKQEDILNGDSVLYADPSMIQMSLDYLFKEEGRRTYAVRLEGDDLARFCKFVSDIWQVHPFVEGNTRTTALFAVLYLRSLGFDVSNDPFEKHARYFRDALVRANYRNPQAGVIQDRSWLIGFLDNLVNGASHKLSREELLCVELFDAPDLLKNVDPRRALVRR